jgi:hypothetical protein
MFSSAQSRFFGAAPESAPTAPGRLYGWAFPLVVPAAGWQPFGRQDAGATRAKQIAIPRWQSKELRWLAAFLPEQQRDDLVFCLGETLRWRARECKPLSPPEKAVERARFGLIGEQLWDIDSATLRQRLRAELRETIRTVEEEQPRLVRNLWLAMHSIRLGQLYHELLSRGEDALEEARSGLNVLWA